MARGVLLLQLGTPEAPTAEAVRPYLRQFLSDPRVIEPPDRWLRYPRLWRIVWKLVLHGVVLRKRPAESAHKYRRIWDRIRGMPLLYYTRRQAELLQASLGSSYVVRFAMRYGRPAISEVLHELLAGGTDRLVVVPLYPQYSATTTASALDGLFAALMRERVLPGLRIVEPYYRHPAYLRAQVDLVRAFLAGLSEPPEFYLLSFHGIPEAYVRRGDPYPQQTCWTAEQIARELGWPPGTWRLTYQSVFGKDPWLQPYTETTLIELAERGIRRVFVATPGFVADCLETIDEIGNEAREAFRRHGGLELYRCPCLNETPQWIEALRELVLEADSQKPGPS